MYRMDQLTHLSSWLDSPDITLLSAAGLRLSRHIPTVHERLDALLEDPVRRALAGLGVVDPSTQTDPTQQALAAIAMAESGESVSVAWLEDMERTVAAAHPHLWPMVARAHVLVNPERERQARITLSVQDLPYAFPGEVNDTQVALFAAGDRVLPALHVDWVRKLTGLACGALTEDLRHQGLWAWPALQVMEPRQVTRTLRRALRRTRRMPAGTKGLTVAYLEQVGVEADVELGPADGLLLDLARATRKRTLR